jgi:hypothetical protein
VWNFGIGVAVIPKSDLPPFADHIHCVVLCASREKVLRIYAGATVASVANKDTAWQAFQAVGLNVGYSVRTKLLAPNHYFPIPMTV